MNQYKVKVSYEAISYGGAIIWDERVYYIYADTDQFAENEALRRFNNAVKIWRRKDKLVREVNVTNLTARVDAVQLPLFPEPPTPMANRGVCK